MFCAIFNFQTRSKKMQFKKSFWASENRQRICGGKSIDVVE